MSKIRGWRFIRNLFKKLIANPGNKKENLYSEIDNLKVKLNSM